MQRDGRAMRRNPRSWAFVLALAISVGCEETTDPDPPPPIRVATVMVTPESVALRALGEATQVTARILDQDGQVLASAPVFWGSRDSSVATVDANGLVTAVGNGTTHVTAASGRIGAHASVLVAQRAVRMDLPPPPDTLRTHGDTVRLDVHGFDGNAHPIPAHAFLWRSGDPAVAAVDSTGLVTAVGNGTTRISIISVDTLAVLDVTVHDREAADRSILVAFYTAAGGPWRIRHNWATTKPLATWAGVTASAEGRVTGLSLRRFGLEGTIAPELGKLPYLRILDLEKNGNLGPLPPELGGLRNLETLLLEDVRVWGAIPPELGDLQSLRTLRLVNTSVSGGIPPELGNLSSLTSLTLSTNPMRGGLPPELGRLSSLDTLRIIANGIGGPIPRELGNLVNLRVLGVRDDWRRPGLQGPIPRELAQLVNLESLGLGNSLTGPLPPELGRLTRLKSLSLWGDLSGPIPGTFGNLRQLRWLSLEYNDLEGGIPPELWDLDQLEGLYLTQNRGLQGPLSASATRLTRLRLLYIDETSLCVPRDSAFDAWLAGMEDFRGQRCR